MPTVSLTVKTGYGHELPEVNTGKYYTVLSEGECTMSVPRVYPDGETDSYILTHTITNSTIYHNGTETDRHNHKMKHICCLYSYLTSAHIHLPFYPHTEQTVTDSASQLPTVPV